MHPFKAYLISRTDGHVDADIKSMEPTAHDPGEVLVNGASGGVAIIAIDMLSQRGFLDLAVLAGVDVLRQEFSRKVALFPCFGKRNVWIDAEAEPLFLAAELELEPPLFSATGGISSCSPPPSKWRTGLGAGFALRIAASLRANWGRPSASPALPSLLSVRLPESTECLGVRQADESHRGDPLAPGKAKPVESL